ncbi:MAG: FG-GAP-like repeat-containing protein [Myxococcota bacterium]
MAARRLGLTAGITSLSLLAFGACDDSAQNIIDPSGTTGEPGDGEGGAGAGNGTGVGAGNSEECQSDDDCPDGGVCNSGTCCNSADSVCGDSCCDGAGETCLFESCVVPGDDCVSEADCPDDQYCEPSLGEPAMEDPMEGCTQAIVPGRCVPKPVICTGEATDPPDCIEDCQFVPDFERLNARSEWQWGYVNAPSEFADKPDVWSTPAIGRVFDANCDGKVDLADPPNVVFISGDGESTFCIEAGTCQEGVLRVLDGRTGEEVFSLDRVDPESSGFAAASVAIGDVDNDQSMDIVAVTGEGEIAIIDATGTNIVVSTDTVTGGSIPNDLGWGGGIALGDMDNDGWTEIAFGRTVFTMKDGNLSRLFTGAHGYGGRRGVREALSYFVDLDGDGDLELLAGNAAYHHPDGATLWQEGNDGFTAVADFDGVPGPEIAHVSGGFLRILDGSSGATRLGPFDIPGEGDGGPPTVADFDGDNQVEVGVAMRDVYAMMELDFTENEITTPWSTPNHDLSSSVTGSSVFDFQGDGKAEVVYMDECFLWVYDGETGTPIFTTNSQSFTGTEAAIVADVDGDGSSEIVVVHNGANPTRWSCAEHTTGMDGYPVWSLPSQGAYRGITILGDVASSWVGTRTLWNQHAYNVTNICDPRDSACTGQTYYGQIPTNRQKNWEQPWLNNFRQNVQDGGLFDAPDVVVKLDVVCSEPAEITVTVRNLGLAGVGEGVNVGIYEANNDAPLATVTTTRPLFSGQSEVLTTTIAGRRGGTYEGRVIIDPENRTFNECREENNASGFVTAPCVD